ncbi:CynX/NimT family MFS transporter [Pseudaestuariivita rosea]|uniref:MFS transporter n=1 Tax=Pseudaestuariivita rosea TaxID=2763263 RepID=UPI001ABA6157|nr:MFS transporter [Pseudaestuariivita rosea]
MDRKTSWGAVLFAYALGVIAAAQVGRIAPAVDILRNDLDLSLSVFGWLVSIISLVSAVFGLGFGSLTMRHGARNMLLLGGLLLAAAVFASSLAKAPWILLITRAFEGVGYLAVVVAAPTLIAQRASPQDTPRVLALWGTFFTLGISMAAYFGGWLSQNLGWSKWFVLNAGLTLLLVVIVFVQDTAKSDTQAAQVPDTTRTSLGVTPWLLASAFFGITVITLSILSMLPPFLIEAKGLSPADAGQVTGLVALTSLAGSALYGWLSARLSTLKAIMTPAVLLVATAFPAFHTSLPLAGTITFVALSVFANGILVAMVFSSVPRMVPSPNFIGPANGLITQIGSIGAVVGPPIVGYAITLIGWLAVPWLVAINAALFALLMIVAERNSLQLNS